LKALVCIQISHFTAGPYLYSDEVHLRTFAIFGVNDKIQPVTEHFTHLWHLSVLKAADSEQRLQALGLPYILRLAAHLGQQALELCLLEVPKKSLELTSTSTSLAKSSIYLGGYSDRQYAHLFFAVAFRQSLFDENKFKFRLSFGSQRNRNFHKFTRQNISSLDVVNISSNG
jgi:hypothetical protein